ncbi:MAG: excinuclease ABC subunit UvrC [Patescibacteria group bacterium]
MPPKSLLDQLRTLPPRPGVYLFRDGKGNILYIGKAKRLLSRVRSYFRVTKKTVAPSLKLSPQKQLMVNSIASLETILVSNETEALLLEAELIKRHHPPYNIILADDKSYVYIKFDFDRAWADVSTVRRPLLPKRSHSILFGPYTSARHAYTALRLAKRIFPYCTEPPSSFSSPSRIGGRNTFPSARDILMKPSTLNSFSEDRPKEKASRRLRGHGAPPGGASEAESRAVTSLLGKSTASFSAGSPNDWRVSPRIARADYRVPQQENRVAANDRALPSPHPPSRPCFNYHLGRCPGACVGIVSPAHYTRIIRRMLPFFRGHYGTLIAQLKSQMQRESDERRYESAAKLRDQIAALRAITARQSIVSVKRESYDIMSAAREGAHFMVNLFKIRDGALTERLLFPLAHAEGANEQEALEAFISLYYARTGDIPPQVYTALPLLSPLPGRIMVAVPKRGKKKKLILMGQENARQELMRRGGIEARASAQARESLETLQNLLHLPLPPARIEAYDISNIQGSYAVGAMTVLAQGVLHPSAYRRFVIKTVTGSNDPAMLAEVLRRRLSHSVADPPAQASQRGSSADLRRHSSTHKLATDKPTNRQTDQWPLPDLIVIDGGVPQLNATHAVLAEYALDIPLLSLAKGRGRKPRAGETIFTLTRERITVTKPSTLNSFSEDRPKEKASRRLRGHGAPPGGASEAESRAVTSSLGKSTASFSAGSPNDWRVLQREIRTIIKLPPSSPALLLLDRVRDEAHRFAITHYRSRHAKQLTLSRLDALPSIGPKTRQLLLTTYGSVEALRRVSREELSALIGSRKAFILIKHLTHWGVL